MSLPCLNPSMASQCPDCGLQTPMESGPCLLSLLQFLAPWFLSHAASSTFSQFILSTLPSGKERQCLLVIHTIE